MKENGTKMGRSTEKARKSGLMGPATMAFLSMITKKVLEGSSTAMVMSTRATGSAIAQMAKASTHTLMGPFTMATGSMTNTMALAKKCGLMGPCSRVSIDMGKNTGQENSYGPMAAPLPETSLKTRWKVEVSTSGWMAANMTACGKIINNMDKVILHGKMDASILVTIKMTSVKVMASLTGKWENLYIVSDQIIPDS